MKNTLFLMLFAVVLTACNLNDASEDALVPELAAISGHYKVVSFYDDLNAQNRDERLFYSFKNDGVFNAFEKLETDPSQTDAFRRVIDGRLRFSTGNTFTLNQFGRDYAVTITTRANGLELRFPYSVNGVLYTDVAILERISFDPAAYEIGLPEAL